MASINPPLPRLEYRMVPHALMRERTRFPLQSLPERRSPEPLLLLPSLRLSVRALEQQRHDLRPLWVSEDQVHLPLHGHTLRSIPTTRNHQTVC